MNKAEAAKEYATKLHNRNQIQYRDQSYIDGHVSLVVLEAKIHLHLVPKELREDILCACWCHDVLEDCPVSYNDLKEVIGAFAADIVYDVTDELGKNRKERQVKTYPKIAANDYAVYVKLCDRIVNTIPSTKKEMYQQEFPGFKKKLYKKGQWEPLWNKLDKITNENKSHAVLE